VEDIPEAFREVNSEAGFKVGVTMTIDHKRSRVERDELRKKYRDLYDRLTELFFRLDPIGIGSEGNEDEYELEVGTILPRLSGCTSESDCLNVIHEEFVRWFDARIAGPASNYEPIAHEVWLIWNEHGLN
jgi:hypothetical protein